MKVFAVIGGYNYSGQDFDTLRLFSNKKDALAYGKELEQSCGYFEIEEKAVEGVNNMCQ